MSGLFVPLDVEYDSDDKMIEAGPMAELLYVRGMAFAKRTGSDGNIRRSQLVIVGRAIPNAAKQAHALVRVGAWVETEDGWHIASWLKRNKPMAEIAADKQRRKAASQKANHDQYHTGPGGKRSSTCPLCAPSTVPKSDASTVPKSAPKGREGKGEPKPEPKPEPEPEPEPEGREGNPVGSVSVSTDETTTDERIVDAIKAHAKHVSVGKDNPKRYADSVRENDMKEHLAEMEAWLIDNPDGTADELAAEVLGVKRTTRRKPTWHANPNCPQCDGDGLTNTANEHEPAAYAPCPCRRAEPYPTTPTEAS